jgi:hypothetical protein
VIDGMERIDMVNIMEGKMSVRRQLLAFPVNPKDGTFRRWRVGHRPADG